MNTNLLYSVLITLITYATWSQKSNYQLSSHILDITSGLPAENVKVSLSKQMENGEWLFIDERNTDINGRIIDFLEHKDQNNNGIFKLTFFTEPYFKLKGIKTFYPYIEVIFKIDNNQHFHVPITLSPFGYSTYRGS